ncbi:MAG: peptidase family protein [Ilumatobacteraceae bacterium]|nr:peptidase family protein [Ilumatobacteraceae bacterium]
MDITDLQHGALLRGSHVDATAARERRRQIRLLRIGVVLAIPLVWFWYRELRGDPVHPGLPTIIRESPELTLLVVLLGMMGLLALLPYLGAGKSPHTLLRPSDSMIRLADVVGADGTRREAIDTLNLFLNHQTFADELGGSPRRGVLFEGPPGTGKTYLAKAMAAEAGVPFLFVSASEFQSMFFGQTNRKVRTFFKAMRKAARAEGGAIGFIEEFDAIGGSRSGMGSGGAREGSVGVVNELLVQMQSFDLPTGWHKSFAKVIDRINSLLPDDMTIKRSTMPSANVLLIAATNRAADLDPALLRPGRFDRVIHFDLPPRADRVEIANFYLLRKRHTEDVSAEIVADVSAGYTPVRIERLLDEALIIALRHGRRMLNLDDIVEAQLITEVGLAHEVGYHPDERNRVAIHEAGHALTAALFGREIRIASILRRGGALGLVSHADVDEKHLRTPSEARDLIAIALAGRAAEIQEFKEASSGIASDLAVATTIAAQLVGQLGAGDSLISLEAAAIPGNLVAKVVSDEPSRRKVESILGAAADHAACMVLENRVALINLARALLERDELNGSEVHRIVADSRRSAAAS